MHYKRKYARDLIKLINMKTVSIVRYTGHFLSCTKEELSSDGDKQLYNPEMITTDFMGEGKTQRTH